MCDIGEMSPNLARSALGAPRHLKVCFDNVPEAAAILFASLLSFTAMFGSLYALNMDMSALNSQASVKRAGVEKGQVSSWADGAPSEKARQSHHRIEQNHILLACVCYGPGQSIDAGLLLGHSGRLPGYAGLKPKRGIIRAIRWRCYQKMLPPRGRSLRTILASD